MRATEPWMWLMAGMIGIGLKFAVRYKGKHIFNPACIGIVTMCLIFDRDVWVSPGQWGQAPLIAHDAAEFDAQSPMAASTPAKSPRCLISSAASRSSRATR